jgi:uncharacterized membrane protein YdjX (TVP38/TMEM64 family)
MMRPRLVAVLLVAAAVLSLAISLLLGGRIVHVLAAAALWLQGRGLAGILIFALLELVLTLVGVVPGAALGIAAGTVFGVTAGFLVSAAGIMAGALVAFGLSRSALRPWIARLMAGQRRLSVLDQMIVRDGWRLVALLRVSPVMPFSITSYALGLSGIGLRGYALGTLASLPPLLGYVVIGALGGAGLSAPRAGHGGLHFWLLAAGGVATLGLTMYLTRLAAVVLRALRVDAAG